MSNALTSEQIKYLLATDLQKTFGYPPPSQTGPIRWHDNYRPCVSRGCGSPTFLSYKKMPYCSAHLLRLINEDLIKLGIE